MIIHALHKYKYGLSQYKQNMYDNLKNKFYTIKLKKRIF